MSAIQQQGRYSRHRWHHLSVYLVLNRKREKSLVLSTLQGRHCADGKKWGVQKKNMSEPVGGESNADQPQEISFYYLITDLNKRNRQELRFKTIFLLKWLAFKIEFKWTF